LFHGIQTYGKKDIEFQSFYELKKTKITYTFILAVATAQGTLVDFGKYME